LTTFGGRPISSAFSNSLRSDDMTTLLLLFQGPRTASFSFSLLPHPRRSSGEEVPGIVGHEHIKPVRASQFKQAI
jgi:hypothetical protein